MSQLVEEEEDERVEADVASAIDRLAREQFGIVTWRQLLARGVHPGRFKRDVAAGRLIRMGPGVYRVCGVRRSWETRAMAAVLGSTAPALVSHQSAAYLYGLDGCGPPGFIDITVPHGRRPRKRAGVTVHESRIFGSVQQRSTVRNLIPVTGMAQTLFDCLAPLRTELERLKLVDDARRRRLVEWEDMWECLLRNAARGRRGTAEFRNLLLKRDGEEPAHGTFVRRTAMLLEEAGLPTPHFEYPALDYYLDISWPPRLVAVECQGRIGHAHERAFENDPIRRNRLQLAGWKVLEVTWARLVDEPAAFVAEVRQALCG